ncbi:MAG: EamA family transporter [Flavobacteriaceae bacterium]|nr:EamA family transporter [Flavobacteriaceae bacterium]
MRNDRLFHYAHLHLLIFIAGFTAILGKLISIDALPLVWYRMGIASLLIFIFLRIRKVREKYTVKTIAGFCLVGLVIALHWLTFFFAIKVSNVSITLAVISSGAFFAAFLEPIFFKRRILWYEVFFGIIAISGLYVIFSIETKYVTGILLALASAFFGGLFSVLNGKFVQKYNPIAISLYEMVAGFVFITLFLMLTGEFSVDFFSILPMDWVYLFILASVCTAYAFIAAVHLMKWISPYTVMLSYNMEPVYGILLALVIFQDTERMSPQFYYGALIILSTVVANGVVKIYLQRKNNRISPS